MSALSSGLRKQLESSVLAARRAAEGASRAAAEGLGVFLDRRPEHLSAEQAALRNGLRAKWRQLGGDRELLVAECAYEQWHRLLFARFLTENGLLLHPQYKAPLTLAECEELAAELGEPDAWAVAARFAAEILPGIFRLDDPCVRLRLAPEGRHALEEILGGLPAEVFIADDALGWVYQFWQKDKKDEVNASERKIGGADLGPVTQLFTENYMVRFLLENSLGAWWAARHPDSALVKGFAYLRFGEDGSPAAGSFEGWPERVAEVTVMDPCCGSGHFLVEAFSMLWQMRAEEEGLSAVQAQDAVLRDNLFGLELDPRCVQIAMFAVALQAWKAGGGWRQLPVPNIACSGIPVRAPVDEWKALAQSDQRLENALVRLHILFRDADTLGSLIDPKRAAEVADRTGLQQSFDDVDWDEVAPLLQKAVSSEADDPATAVLGVDAAGNARAADYLSRRYTLVCTNPPFLGIGRFAPALSDYLGRVEKAGRRDLALATVERSWRLSRTQSLAFVTPGEWTYQRGGREFRKWLVEHMRWAMIAWLGGDSFVIPVRAEPVLLITDGASGYGIRLIDARHAGIEVKSEVLRTEAIEEVSRSKWGSAADQRILPGLLAQQRSERPLGEIADARAGVSAGDSNRFEAYWWEVDCGNGAWEYLQTSPAGDSFYSGREKAIRWEGEAGEIRDLAESVKHLNHIAQNWRRGKPLWTRSGIVVSQIGGRSGFYSGEIFDSTCFAVVPENPDNIPALVAFSESGDLVEELGKVHPNWKLTSPKTLLQLPFDVEYWHGVAAERYPDGLPEPWSDDPTQWLFEGRPEVSTEALQVAVARLVGFRWPEQSDAQDLDGFADADGIVCLPSVAGEAPAADRLQQLLAVAFGDRWSPSMVTRLLSEAGSKKRNLADWLRDDFFKQHCALFENRPFVWHIWDGLKDGFSVLVNYHRLDRKTLEKLTYTYLGTDWVERQRAEARDEVAGAEARLEAALELQRKLELILEGEAPFDVYVRWKSVADQPVRWDPDLNDGVRLNIRPFVEAGVLRSTFNIHWRKDRGTNPDGSERHNDIHLTLADKANARAGQART